jgi:acyl-CoA synthetase (AMP-forming)/AMP-acid ligase II
VINVGGYKVDPLEVERVVREALPVGEVIVLAGTRADLPAVKVVVEADPARVTPAMVVAACRARLSPYKVPAEVEVRARIERTASGKIVRTSLDGR